MCRVFLFDLKVAVAAMLVSCLIAGAFCAVSGPSVAKDETAPVYFVDRTLKGDRLTPNAPLANGPAPASPAKSSLRKVPLGCDRAFSPAADPAHAHVFGRCTA
jgi:hypothetical protein